MKEGEKAVIDYLLEQYRENYRRQKEVEYGRVLQLMNTGEIELENGEKPEEAVRDYSWNPYNDDFPNLNAEPACLWLEAKTAADTYKDCLRRLLKNNNTVDFSKLLDAAHEADEEAYANILEEKVIIPASMSDNWLNLI